MNDAAMIALLSAVTMLGTCAVPVFAGELTGEELIRKYAPDGAYSYDDVYLNPCDFLTVMAEGSADQRREQRIQKRICQRRYADA